MHANHNRGVINTTNRMLAGFLNKPEFKENLRITLKNIDPESSPELVKTLLWQDIEVSLGLLGALPGVANSLIRAIDELLIQIVDKFTPDLLAGFVGSLLDEIDAVRLQRIIQNIQPLARDLSPLLKELLQQAGHDSVTQDKGQP